MTILQTDMNSSDEDLPALLPILPLQQTTQEVTATESVIIDNDKNDAAGNLEVTDITSGSSSVTMLCYRCNALVKEDNEEEELKARNAELLVSTRCANAFCSKKVPSDR